MKFGKFLKAKREEMHLTLDELALMCGVSSIYLYDIENDQTDTFAEGIFYKMANILSIDGDEFIIKSGRIPKWAYKYIIRNWPQVKASLMH